MTHAGRMPATCKNSASHEDEPMKNDTVIRFDPGLRLKRHQRSHAPLDPIAEYLANVSISGPWPPELDDLIDQGREDGSVVEIERGVFRTVSGIVIDVSISRSCPNMFGLPPPGTTNTANTTASNSRRPARRR
jgi:hypothetical protein